MSAQDVLARYRVQGWQFRVEGDQLRIHHDTAILSPGERQELQIHKPALLSLLAVESPSPHRIESEASSPAVERQAQQQGESHVPPASDTHSLSPSPCSHTATYRRLSGVLVCLDCGWTLAPGATDWQPQTITYCTPGQHPWLPRCEGDGGMLQCSQCPAVQAASTAVAERPRDPAIHDPQCDGRGLVVVPGWGWSCPQCNRRYVVPEAPASTTPAQAALPLLAGPPHGEIQPQRKVRR